MNTKDRLEIVRELLELPMPLEEVVVKLSEVDWDYEGQGVDLTRKHLASALKRFLQSEISDLTIELWANQIEGREDIQFEKGSEKVIDEVLHELANPALTQPLDRVRAGELLRKLSIL